MKRILYTSPAGQSQPSVIALRSEVSADLGCGFGKFRSRYLGLGCIRQRLSQFGQRKL
jgi:hypothetical protein